jgi:hypothetical protein
VVFWLAAADVGGAFRKTLMELKSDENRNSEYGDIVYLLRGIVYRVERYCFSPRGREGAAVL